MKIKVRVVKKEVIEKSIDTEYIRLDAFLKLCGAVQTGGHAKNIIQSSLVKVNGEVCTMRGKKLRKNDTAEYENKVYKVT